jgi:hypothetical protein
VYSRKRKSIREGGGREREKGYKRGGGRKRKRKRREQSTRIKGDEKNGDDCE